MNYDLEQKSHMLGIGAEPDGSARGLRGGDASQVNGF